MGEVGGCRGPGIGRGWVGDGGEIEGRLAVGGRCARDDCGLVQVRAYLGRWILY